MSIMGNTVILIICIITAVVGITIYVCGEITNDFLYEGVGITVATISIMIGMLFWVSRPEQEEPKEPEFRFLGDEFLDHYDY